jgi:fluoroquinolone resistance protein
MNLFNGQTEFNKREFKSGQLRAERVKGLEFEGCSFIKSVFRESQFLDCRFRGCTFRGCDLGMLVLKGSEFSECRFEDCQLIGVNWTETTWEKGVFLKPADFVGCALNHSSFLGLNLRKVSLTRCTAHNVDFAEANLTQANCVRSDFLESRFLHTDLTGADFSGATNYAISPTQNTLKKTKFSLPDAMALLYGLDIVLTDAP